MWYRVFVHTTCKYQKHTFSKNQLEPFCKYTVPGGIDMLPKRSTPVDQIFGSDRTHSKLSVAIFIAPRTHLEADKS